MQIIEKIKSFIKKVLNKINEGIIRIRKNT